MSNTNKTYNALILESTKDYLNGLNKNQSPPPSLIEYDILKITNNRIDEYNLGDRNPDADDSDPMKVKYPYQKQGSKKYPNLKTLTPSQIAEILLKLYYVKRIAPGGFEESEDKDLLGIYQKDGAEKGVYKTEKDNITRLARKYNYSLKISESKEIISILRDISPRVETNKDKDLIAVNNGIFDYKEKKLYDFSPEYIFLAKSHVNMNFNAKNPKITMPDGLIWDVETWIKDLTYDEDIEKSLWEIISAILRPHVPWGKAAWLYSESGNNGKGTYVTLLRNLVGRGAYASISLKNFTNPFMLEPLKRVNAIIVDENPVGVYIDQADDLKAVTTNDIISVNAKYEQPISLRFHGFMVQCLNEFPRVRDKSDSFYRRQLFIPMEKRFEGKERKYIKNDYLNRKEVLEYVMYKVLYKTNFYELSIPEKSKEVLEKYKLYNDPIRQFFKDVEEKCVWDFLPNEFLYEFYKAWIEQNLPKGEKVGRNRFLDKIRLLVKESDVIEDFEKQQKITDELDKPEPLIIEYEIKKWYNENYKGTDKEKIASPNKVGKRLRGFGKKQE